MHRSLERPHNTAYAKFTDHLLTREKQPCARADVSEPKAAYCSDSHSRRCSRHPKRSLRSLTFGFADLEGFLRGIPEARLSLGSSGP
jgi:hypothetical protein